MVPHINEPVASFYTTVVESMKVHRANIENFLDEHSEPILVIEDLSQLQCKFSFLKAMIFDDLDM